MPSDELAGVGGAIPAPAPTLRTGRRVVFRDGGLLLPFQEAALPIVVHDLADRFDGLFHLVGSDVLRFVVQSLAPFENGVNTKVTKARRRTRKVPSRYSVTLQFPS